MYIVEAEAGQGRLRAGLRGQKSHSQHGQGRPQCKLCARATHPPVPSCISCAAALRAESPLMVCDQDCVYGLCYAIHQLAQAALEAVLGKAARLPWSCATKSAARKWRLRSKGSASVVLGVTACTCRWRSSSSTAAARGATTGRPTSGACTAAAWAASPASRACTTRGARATTTSWCACSGALPHAPAHS